MHSLPFVEHIRTIYNGDISSSGRYSLEAHSGKVEMTIPSNSAFDLSASTFSGSIKTDFKVAFIKYCSPIAIYTFVSALRYCVPLPLVGVTFCSFKLSVIFAFYKDSSKLDSFWIFNCCNSLIYSIRRSCSFPFFFSCYFISE